MFNKTKPDIKKGDLKMDILKSISAVVFPVILIAAVVYEVKRTIKHRNFDERQRMVQGQAFRLVFYTSMILDAVIILLEASGITLMSALVFAGIQLYVGMIVFVSYTVIKDAYFTVSERAAGLYSLMLAVIGVMNLAVGIRQLKDRGLIEDGMLSRNCLGLLIGVSFLLLAAVFFAKMYIFKGETDDE